MTADWCFVSLLFYGFIVQTNGLFRTRGLPLLSKLEPDPNQLVENNVRQSGYPFELHHTTTRDGYILAMHRIPPNNLSEGTPNRRVVLIMHGLLGSSADWLVTGRNRSIAYLLADDGYDVWLGNSRGTTNSKNHTTLSIGSRQFWDFSWHEMGIYDLPAMIDYVLNKTGQTQLFYIGFSQGTTQFWVMTSLKPEYNSKIKLMSALAPVAYMGHAGGLLRPISFFANLLKLLYKFTGYFELFANTPAEKVITHYLCQKNTFAWLCGFVLASIGGFSHGEVDLDHLADYLQFAPAGCSFKQLIHYAMNIQNPGRFRFYDYGMLGNFKKYRHFSPLEYPVQSITAPVILYIGLNDFLADPDDVEILSKQLPNLLEKHTVTEKRIGHFDFIYGKTIRELVYNYLIKKMNSIP